MMNERQQIVWNPIHNAIEARMNTGDKLLMIISPFIKQGALEVLLANCCLSSDAKVIVRWRAEDICNKVTDIGIYSLLTDKNVSLYRNDRIHLKVYIFESNETFITSGNLTNSGFGYANIPNIEVGSFIRLTPVDWTRIYALIECSTLIDDDLFAIFQTYAGSCPIAGKSIPPLEFPKDMRKPYSRYSLPASEQPELLYSYYESSCRDTNDPENDRKFIHDLGLYEIPPDLGRQQFMEHLQVSFTAQPFVQDLIAFIRAKKTARFGTVNDWIYGHCSDVPLPYRWELKENTSILYNWLDYFIDEIHWDIPGTRSQVIYWNESGL